MIGLWLFIIGVVIGSFLNVVVYRTVYDKSPLEGRSKCPECEEKISWKHNIPLLSYVLLKGRCAHCNSKISLQYPVVELLSGLLFVWWYVVGWSFFQLVETPLIWIQPIFWLGVGIALLLVTVFDFKYGIIPNGLNVALFVWVMVYRLGLVGMGRMQTRDFLLALLSSGVLAAFFYFLYRITKRQGFGFGDVKLAPSLGLILGWPKILVGVMASFVIGGVVAVVLMILGKKKMKETIVFGPFLTLGTLISLWWGDYIWSWYMTMLK